MPRTHWPPPHSQGEDGRCAGIARRARSPYGVENPVDSSGQALLLACRAHPYRAHASDTRAHDPPWASPAWRQALCAQSRAGPRPAPDAARMAHQLYPPGHRQSYEFCLPAAGRHAHGCTSGLPPHAPRGGNGQSRQRQICLFPMPGRYGRACVQRRCNCCRPVCPPRGGCAMDRADRRQRPAHFSRRSG